MNESSSSLPASVAKEYSDLSPIIRLQKERLELDDEERSYQELQQDLLNQQKQDDGGGSGGGDGNKNEDNDQPADNDDDENEELLVECREELQRISNDRIVLEEKIVDAILPQDEQDYKFDALLEIRAGTGGDEAALFASELLDGYIKAVKSIIANSNSYNWKVEVLSTSKTDLGGVREGSFLVSNNASSHGNYTNSDGQEMGPYGVLKYESGVHRVQRVPVNDTKIHTSACSVAVLPSLPDTRGGENSSFTIPPSELKIETMRSSGAGGQHVNTTDSAVRITHVPTGITASIQDERSQHQNKEKAMKLIHARVYDKQRRTELESVGATRSSLMGGGDRSERIRTFNFPQDRITDHRCKETRHGISNLLNCANDDNGSHNIIATFLPYLRMMRREEQLEELNNSSENNNNNNHNKNNKRDTAA